MTSFHYANLIYSFLCRSFAETQIWGCHERDKGRVGLCQREAPPIISNGSRAVSSSDQGGQVSTLKPTDTKEHLRHFFSISCLDLVAYNIMYIMLYNVYYMIWYLIYKLTVFTFNGEETFLSNWSEWKIRNLECMIVIQLCERHELTVVLGNLMV